MPVRRSIPEQYEVEAAKLRSQRLELQREIADHLVEQQRVYDTQLKPYAAQARLMQAAVRKGERPLDEATAKLVTGVDTPTARFEVARTEIDRISKLVSAKRNRLSKVEKELASARENLRRLGRADADTQRPGDGSEAAQILGSAHGEVLPPSLPGYLRERLDALRALASFAGTGGGLLS